MKSIPSARPSRPTDNTAQALAHTSQPLCLARADAGAPSAGWPVLDSLTSKALEARFTALLPPHTLMARAGLGLARLAVALAPFARQIIILCGPGNNGGDGLEAAALLKRWGYPVSVYRCISHKASPSDASLALDLALQEQVPMHDWSELSAGAVILSPQDLIIDALLGLGQDRAPSGDLAQAVHWATQAQSAGTPVLAVDLPTGMNADTGQAFDAQCCIQAHWTLALLSLKPGLFTGQGKDWSGQVWWDDLGTLDSGQPSASAHLINSALVQALRPKRPHNSHKGVFGDVWLLGGAPSMGGALLLAAHAAATVGAGRVYACPLDEQAGLLDAAHPHLMFRPSLSLLDETPGAIQSQWAKACVVAGCGGGQRVAQYLALILERTPRLVLDADALNAIADAAPMLKRLRARAARGWCTVLTPHPLEAARLLKTALPKAQDGGAQAIQADRIAAARRLADLTDCTIVLKGSGSVIASPASGPLWINSSGNASLASAGTGDVLAGMIGGYLAQGLSASDACILATYQHGAVADQWTREHRGPLLAPTLIERWSCLPENDSAAP